MPVHPVQRGGHGPGITPGRPDPEFWLPPPRRMPSAGVIAALLVVALALAAGAAWVFTHSQNDSAVAEAGADAEVGTGNERLPVDPPVVAPLSGESSSSGSPEESALAALTNLRQESLARLVLDGRFVAQVASKSVGITDALQLAQNGTHTFYAVDILAESRAAAAVEIDPSSVYVLWGTDFGKRSTAPDGSPYWVTLVDARFSSADDVSAWCAATYASLSPTELANTCAVRQFTSPHD